MRRVLQATVCLAVGLAALGWWNGGSAAQTMPAPVNDLPNSYSTVEGWAKMPAGRTWGSTSAVDVDKDGKSIWVAERCGANSCLGSNVPVVLKFDSDGTLVKSFGEGLMIFPHGIHVDRDGNIWVTDGQDTYPRRRPGQPADAPLPPMPDKIIGNQVFKFSPDGKILMTLGKPGGNQPGQPADPASFYQPNDVITFPNGDIVVAEGHGGANARLIRFDKAGTFIKDFGKKGTALQGEFDQPHGLAFDSKGRLFVADRSNNRIQILDPDSFKTLDTWYQFSRLSGIWITKGDVLYGADSESGSVNPPHGAWKRGIRIGSATDGKVQSFIPDPSGQGVSFAMVDGKPVMTTADGKPGPTGTLAAEGVAVDAAGNIYGAEVGPRALKRYVKK